MPKFFPENYEQVNIAQKKKFIKYFEDESKFTALNIALNAHAIYDFLKKQGIVYPNRLFVELFQYTSNTLDVPYEIIDEAFLTQTPLTEKRLFNVSPKFNPKAIVHRAKNLPLIPITIDFYSIIDSLFEQLPFSFWEQFYKKETLFTKNDSQAYNLEALFQELLKKVWAKSKESIDQSKETVIENTRQMFLAYFYNNDKRYYRPEIQKMLLFFFEKCLEENTRKNFKINEELAILLKGDNTELITKYIIDNLKDWTEKENYKRFLRSIIKTRNMSLMNQLLLLYQRYEALETKEINSWIYEHRTIKETAQPIFLFGESLYLNNSTKKNYLNKKLSLLTHPDSPIVPYFE